MFNGNFVLLKCTEEKNRLDSELKTGTNEIISHIRNLKEIISKIKNKS